MTEPHCSNELLLFRLVVLHHSALLSHCPLPACSSNLVLVIFIQNLYTWSIPLIYLLYLYLYLFPRSYSHFPIRISSSSSLPRCSLPFLLRVIELVPIAASPFSFPSSPPPPPSPFPYPSSPPPPLHRIELPQNPLQESMRQPLDMPRVEKRFFRRANYYINDHINRQGSIRVHRQSRNDRSGRMRGVNQMMEAIPIL